MSELTSEEKVKYISTQQVDSPPSEKIEEMEEIQYTPEKLRKSFEDFEKLIEAQSPHKTPEAEDLIHVPQANGRSPSIENISDQSFNTEESPIIIQKKERSDEALSPSNKEDKCNQVLELSTRMPLPLQEKIMEFVMPIEKRTKANEGYLQNNSVKSIDQNSSENDSQVVQVKKGDLEGLLRKAVESNLPEFARLIGEQLKVSDECKETSYHTEEIKSIHAQCYCDGCGMCPIKGIRYRCSVCDDFDFCERCEAKKEHPHLFLKIKNPDEYSKLAYNSFGSRILAQYDQELKIKEIGKKIKESAVGKIVTNLYDHFFSNEMVNEAKTASQTNSTQ